MINLRMLYNFTLDYAVSDFQALINSVCKHGFIDDDAIFEAALMLYYDYEDLRCNAFAYLNKQYDARTLMELRKSCILRLPVDFFQEHPDDNYEKIKKYRSAYLRLFLKDYNDENWQYWWATRLFIPEKNRESFEFVYEFMLEDGVPELDNFENPAKALAKRIVYNDRDKFSP